jgi:hypothetical protein
MRSTLVETRGDVMVHREKVTDAKGRQWVTGSLDSETYFAEVRRRARAQAERVIAARLDEPPPAPRHSAAAPA